MRIGTPRLVCCAVAAAASLVFTLSDLGAQEDKEVRRLVERLEKAQSLMVYRYADTLASLGPVAAQAVPRLLKNLDDKDSDRRYGSETALERMGPIAIAALPALVARTRDPKTRGTAVRILVKVAPGSVRQMLEDFALNDSSIYVRQRALEAITSDSLLARISTSAPEAVAEMARRKISSQAVLANLARASKDMAVVDGIVARLTERPHLLSLVRSGPTSVRRAALAALPSFVVADMATKEPDPQVRLDAVWYLADSAMLASIAVRDADAAVKAAAQVSLRGKRGDLKVDGLDCRPAGGSSYTCAVRIVNSGTVAYSDIRYVLGTTLFGSESARGAPKYLDFTLQPGESREMSIPFYAGGVIGGVTQAQCRIVSAAKAKPDR